MRQVLHHAWLLVLLVSLPLSAAERVISLAPHTTELAYAAGLGSKMIAASEWSDYPPEANQLEKVASWQGINTERILALKPDLVLAYSGNAQRPLEQLASFGIPILYLEPQNSDEIARAIEQLADHSPDPQRAHREAQRIRAETAVLQQRYAHRPSLSVFLQFGTQPLFTSATNTLQSQILTLCGGENIFADSRVPWPQVGREQVLMRHPQAIVINGEGSRLSAVKKFWSPQLNVPIIALNEDWFNRGGPRALLAAEQLCQQLDALRPTAAEAH